MYERLQRYRGEVGQTSSSTRTTEIILDNNYAIKVKGFIESAETEIRLCAYAWRWYDSEPELEIQQLNLELLKACRRGLQVRVLVDTEAMREKFNNLGFPTRAVQNTKMLHTKAVAIDHKTLIIGSHNLTKRANSDNYELSVAIQEFEPIEQFINYFDRIWLSRG